MLDPSIITSGQTPQPQNPLQTIGAIAALKNQQQEAQLRGVQLQGAQQENQNRQLAMEQTAAANQAYSEAFNPKDGSIDTDKLTSAMVKSGHGTAVPGLLEGVQKYQKGAAETATARTKAATDQANFFGGIGSTLVDANGDPLLARSLIQHAVKQGAIDPNSGGQFLQQIDTALAQDPTGATARASTLKLAQQAVSQSPEQRELALKKQTSDAAVTTAAARAATAATGQQKADAELPGLKANSDLAVTKDIGGKLSAVRNVADYQKVFNSLSPADQERAKAEGFVAPDQVHNAKDVMAATKTAGDLTKTAHERTDEAQGAQRVGIAGAQLGIAQQKNKREQETFEQTGMDPSNPGVMDALIDQIGNYQRKAPNLTTRNGQPTPLSIALAKKYPDYQEQNFSTYQKTENAFTSGKEGDLARSLNTATAHLGALKTAGDALKNGNIQILNTIANSLGVQVGSDAKTTYDTIVHRVTPEIAKAYIPGGGGEGERSADAKDFSSSASDSQRNNAIGISAKLLQSQVQSLQDQYKRGTYGRGKQDLFTPEATKFLNSVGGGNVSVGDLPKGAGKVIDKDTAQSYYKAAGGDPAKARQLATQNGWKLQ